MCSSRLRTRSSRWSMENGSRQACTSMQRDRILRRKPNSMRSPCFGDVIAVDSIEQAKMEAGDLIQAFEGDESRWDSVSEISQIVAAKADGRQDAEEITLFKSIGIAEEDVATAARVYQLAREKGIGREVPMWSDEKR